MCFIKEQTLTFNWTFSITALCNVAIPDILLLFYLFICLFIDEEAGNVLAVGCTAFKKTFCGFFLAHLPTNVAILVLWVT